MTTATVKFTNFASTTLVGTYGVGDTALTVASTSGFPTPVLGTSWFYAVITDSLTAPTKREVVKVTNVSGSIYTVVRAQDGSLAQTWATGSYFELRVVNKALQDLFDEAVTLGTAVPSSLSSTTNLTLTYDSDNNGSGTFDVLSGPDTVLQIANNGELIASPGYANIKDFGGDPTGVTECNTAFAAAIAAGYEAIYFPKGTYSFTSALTVTNQNLTVFGDGPQISVVKITGGAGFNWLNWTGVHDEYATDKLVVKNLTINTACASGVAQGIAINASLTPTALSWKPPRSGVIIDSVEIEPSVLNACFSTGIKCDTVPSVKINKCHIDGFLHGVYSAGTRAGAGVSIISRGAASGLQKATEVNITDTIFYQCSVGVEVNNSVTSSNNYTEGVHIDGSTVLNCTTGIKVGNTAAVIQDGLPGFYVNDTHISATDIGIDLQGVTQFFITNCLIYSQDGTTFSGVKVISPSTVGFHANGLIQGNTFVKIGSYSGNTYGLNFVGASATPGSSGVRVVANGFEGFTNAVTCDANSFDVHISPDNRVYTGGSYTGTLGTTNLASAFAGNVGIGTTPSYRLHIKEPATNANGMIESGSGYASWQIKGSGTNNAIINFYNATTGELARLTADNTGVLTFSSGAGTEVGKIGTTGFTFPNLAAIYFKDTGGTAQNCVQYYSDNGLYIQNPYTNGHILIRATGGGSVIVRKADNSRDFLHVHSSGQIRTSEIHNNATAQTDANSPQIASGTYTATVTAVTNVSAVTSYTAQWMRVGNVVTVSGKCQIDPTAAGAIAVRIALPIASALANGEQLSGTAVNQDATIAPECGFISADTTNDAANLGANVTSTANNSWSFHFTYVVL